MDPTQRESETVRSIRTFADDVARANVDAPSEKQEPQKEKAKPTLPIAPKVPSLEIPRKKIKKTETTPTPKSTAVHKTEESSVHLPDDVFTEPKQPPDDKLEGAEIVRDTVRNRWTLRKALTHGLKDWFAEQQRLASGGEDAAPDIAPASARTPIIQKASVGSVIAPQDDYTSAVEKIKAEQQNKQTEPLDVPLPIQRPKEDQGPAEAIADTVSHARWTHTLEDALNLKESSVETPDEKKPAIKYARPIIAPKEEPSLKIAQKPAVTPPEPTPEIKKEKHAPDTPVNIPVGVSDVAPVVQHSRSKDEPFIPPAPVVTPQVETLKPSPIVHKESTQTAQTDTHHTEIPKDISFLPETEPEPEVPKSASTPTRPKQTTSSSPANTRILRTYRGDAIDNVEERRLSKLKIATVEAKERERRAKTKSTQVTSAYTPPEERFPVVLVLVLVFAVLAGSFTGYLWFVYRTPIETVSITRVPTFIANIEQQPIPFNDTRSDFMNTLSDAVVNVNASNALVQLYPTIAATGTDTVASSAEFMSVLDPRTSGSFVRSLRNEMMFGAYAGEFKSPFLVLKTEQFDVAFAGMLAWEENMSADFSPLFGEPVRRSFDPTSFAADSAGAPTFVDDVLRNTNVRILYDELGETRIIYAFVDKNTIVITTRVEAMIRLIEALRN